MEQPPPGLFGNLKSELLSTSKPLSSQVFSTPNTDYEKLAKQNEKLEKSKQILDKYRNVIQEYKEELIQMSEEKQEVKRVKVKELELIIESVSAQRNTALNKLAVEQARNRALLQVVADLNKQISQLNNKQEVPND